MIHRNDIEERLQIVCVGAHGVRSSATTSELRETIDQPMTNDIDVADITLTDDSTNLRNPDHHDSSRVSSARGKPPRTPTPAGGSPVKCRYRTLPDLCAPV